MNNSRTYVAAGVAFLIIAFAALYYFFDPMEATWMPRCLWKLVTGTECPGCGTQRMAHALLHGDIAAAWQANAYALCMLPVIAFLVCIEFARQRFPRLYRKVHSPMIIYLLGVSILAWWLIRNF